MLTFVWNAVSWTMMMLTKVLLTMVIAYLIVRKAFYACKKWLADYRDKINNMDYEEETEYFATTPSYADPTPPAWNPHDPYQARPQVASTYAPPRRYNDYESTNVVTPAPRQQWDSSSTSYGAQYNRPATTTSSAETRFAG